MKDLVARLKANPKIENINVKHVPSLEDETPISSACVVLNTKYNRFNWGKTIYVEPSEETDKFNIEFYFGANDPNKSLLSEIYNRCKTKDFEPAKYGHDKPMLNLLVNESDLNKIINWFYSTLN